MLLLLGIIYAVLPNKLTAWWSKRWTMAFLCGLYVFWSIYRGVEDVEHIAEGAAMLLFEILLVGVYAIIQLILRAIDKKKAKNGIVMGGL